MNIGKEEKILARLEFDYNIARISKQDEEIVKKTKIKYKKQLIKVLKAKRTALYEKMNKDSVNLLEELI